MPRECWKPFPHHRPQRKPLVNDPGMRHGTCVTHVPWCMSGSLTRGGGENVPDIPGACATRNVTYLIRGPLAGCTKSREPLEFFSLVGWCPETMVCVFRQHNVMFFRRLIFLYFESNFTKICSQCSKYHETIIGSFLSLDCTIWSSSIVNGWFVYFIQFLIFRCTFHDLSYLSFSSNSFQ